MLQFASEFKKYTSYIDFYSIIRDYSLDLPVFRRGVFPTELINEEEFFDQLYVTRKEQEESLKDKLRFSSGVVLLIGEPGSGKSTISLKIMRDLKLSGAATVRQDLRATGEYPLLATISDNLERQLIDQLIQRVLVDFFPFTNLDSKTGEFPDNAFLRLVAFLIDPNPANEFFKRQQRQVHKAEIWYQQYLIDPKRSSRSYYDWLRDNYAEDPRIGEFITEISGDLRISEVLYAIDDIYRPSQIVIWVDNIDILSMERQIVAQTLYSRLSKSIAQIATLVLSIREENVYREYVLDESGIPPFPNTVGMYSEDQRMEPAWAMPQYSRFEMRQVINNRLKFARDKLRYMFEHEPQTYLHYTQTSEAPISNDNYKNFVALSGKILAGFDRAGAARFCNNSFRLLLGTHGEFLEHFFYSSTELASLKDLDEVSIPDFNDYSESQIITAFFSWMRRHEVVDFPFDLIASKNRWESSRTDRIGCPLEMLVVSVTWNLMLEGISNDGLLRLPRIADVTSRLKKLDFHDHEVVLVVLDLHRRYGNRANFLEIETPSLIKIANPSDLDFSFRIAVTTKGMMYLRTISYTFGYLLECEIMSHSEYLQDVNIPNFLNPASNEFNERIAFQRLFPHICDIVEMCIHDLINIRKSGEIGVGKKWFEDFLKKFGVPFGREIASLSLYTSTNGRRNYLPVELLISTLLAFRHNLHMNQVKQLQQLIQIFFERLQRVIEYNEPTSGFETTIKYQLGMKEN